METLEYTQGIRFEFLMKRAFQTQSSDKYNHRDSGFVELINIKTGRSLIKGQTYKKQCQVVGDLLNQAANKFLDRNLNSEERENIVAIQKMILESNDDQDLWRITEKMLDATQRFK